MKRALCIVALAAATAHADDSAFERGVDKFQHEDFAGAVPLLGQAHEQAPNDADIALLLGISYYRTSQLERARPLLEQAERDGDADGQASARVFLGLIADHEGHDERARAYYEQVAHGSPSELSASARLLIDQAGPARWLVVGVLRPEYDSNVALLPMTVGRGHDKGSADGELDLVLAVSARPFDGVPLVLDQTVAYGKQATLSDYDWLSDRIGASYVVVRGRERATLGYHFEASQLGGSKYQRAHVVELTGRHRLHDALALGARYTFAARDYGSDYAGFSGLTHLGVIEVIRGTKQTTLELAGGYQVAREGADDSTLTMIGHGPRCDLRWRSSKQTELRASLSGQDRLYEGHRRDLYVSTEMALYYDLSAAVGFVGGASYTIDESTEKSFTYSKWTAFLGMIVVVSE